MPGELSKRLDEEVLKGTALGVGEQLGSSVRSISRHVRHKSVARGHAQHVVEGPRVDQGAVASELEVQPSHTRVVGDVLEEATRLQGGLVGIDAASRGGGV
jgi:hypothetical protein